MYLLNVSIIWRIKLNKCMFSSQFYSLNCVLIQQCCRHFMKNMLRLAATIWKFFQNCPVSQISRYRNIFVREMFGPIGFLCTISFQCRKILVFQNTFLVKKYLVHKFLPKVLWPEMSPGQIMLPGHILLGQLLQLRPKI